MENSIWHIQLGDNPLIAAALHDGHELRPEIAQILALSEEVRRREEDPYTSRWTSVADTRIVALLSRFEVDFNRPREKAIYLCPEDAWGLQVWKEPPSEQIIKHALAEYDSFYSEIYRLFTDFERRLGRFVVFDLHSYNHRRGGPDGPVADPKLNPDVNVGTGSMDRNRWAPVVDRFMSDLRLFDFPGRHLDVRENVKFKGGCFPQWTHTNFPETACVIAIEFKKFFMDEWTGRLFPVVHEAIEKALRSTVPGIREILEEMGERHHELSDSVR